MCFTGFLECIEGREDESIREDFDSGDFVMGMVEMRPLPVGQNSKRAQKRLR
jgi:hypothetical protein